MQLKLVYKSNTGKSVEAIVGVGDDVIVLVGKKKRHPQPGTITEVISVNKAKVSLPDGNAVIFNKNRLRLPAGKEN